jgi:hypothetical protein
MSDATLATVAPLLDKYFTKDISEVVFDIEDCDPWIAYLQLNGENTAGGNDGNIVVRVTDDGDIVVSPDLESAGGSIGTYRFTVPVSKLEWKARIRREALDATKGSPRGVFDLAKKTIAAHVRQSIIKLAKHSLTKRGCLGVIKGVSGSDITIGSLSTATGSTASADLGLENRFRAGMILVASDALATGNLRDTVALTADTLTVLAVTPGTTDLTLTMSGAISGTEWAAGDYLFEKGDSYFSRATRRTMAGAFEWVDYIAPVDGEDFFGNDRFDHPNLTAMRYNATGKAYKTALLKARSKFKQLGKPAPDTAFISQTAYDEIEDDTDKSSVVTVMLNKEGPGGRVLQVGVTGIRLTNGNGGTLDVVALPFMEHGIFLMGNTKKSPFVLSYTDKLVRMDTMAGMWRLEEVSDGTEKHVTYVCQGSTRGAIYCTNPGNWLVGYGHTGP